MVFSRKLAIFGQMHTTKERAFALSSGILKGNPSTPPPPSQKGFYPPGLPRGFAPRGCPGGVPPTVAPGV